MYSFTDYEFKTIINGYKYFNKNDKKNNKQIKNIRVCLYLRKSTEDYKDNSLKLQIDEINKFIKYINEKYESELYFYYEEEDVYKEDNESGMKGRLRKEFNRMLSIIENNPGYYGVCLVYKMDRFSRKLEDTLNYMTLLKSYRCVLKALDFDDNGDPTSDLLKNILGVVAQYHAQNSALTSIKGTIKKVEQNKNVGLLPVGLTTKKVIDCNFTKKGASDIVIDENKSLIIKEIFVNFSNGKSVSDIVKMLNDKGYTKNNGTCFTKQNIYYILRNKRYNGTYIYADPNKKRTYKYDNGVNKPEPYISKNAFPKIIDDDLFEKVQRKVSKCKINHQLSISNTNYLLSGILFCECCNSNLHGWSRPKYKGKIYFDYVCSTHKNHKELCSTKRINKNYIENVIFELLSIYLNKLLLKITSDFPHYEKLIVKRVNKLFNEIDNIKKEINIRKQKIDKIFNRIISDNKCSYIYEEQLKKLEDQIDNLSKTLEILENKYLICKHECLNNLLTFTINKEILKSNFDFTKSIILTIFEKITISNEFIKIYFFNK